MVRHAFLCLLAAGCWNPFAGGGYSTTGYAQQPVWSPSPPRPPGAYTPLPLEVVFGKPPPLIAPRQPFPEPEYEPLVAATDKSVWLPGHWRWELGWLWSSEDQQWRQPAGWLWAQGRWIEPPCEGVALVNAEYRDAGYPSPDVHYVEPHWTCAPEQIACNCRPSQRMNRPVSAKAIISRPK
jgi:hypothetical protein